MVWKDLNGEGITGIILSYSIAWLFPPHVLLSKIDRASYFLCYKEKKRDSYSRCNVIRYPTAYPKAN